MTDFDITERKELENHKNKLIAELDHRVKNVVAIVSTVASRTQETSGSTAELVAALDGRIKSMAPTPAHDIRKRKALPMSGTQQFVRDRPTPPPVIRTSVDRVLC
jgi:hypothetical protein